MFYFVTAVFLGVCMVTDLLQKQIWWPVTALFMAVSFLVHLLRGDMEPWNMVAGIGLGISLMAVSWVTREAIGYGDGLTVAACGAALGFITVLPTLLLALIFAAVWSGIMLICRRAGRKDCFPFIPFLMAAQVCVTVLGG